MEKLTTTEHKYMCMIWDHPEGILSSEIYKHYPQTMGSKSSILHRVVHKGCARWKQKGRQVEYYPLVTRLEYDQFMLTRELKLKMGLNSIDAIIAKFCGKNQLTKEQSAKLNDLINEIK